MQAAYLGDRGGWKGIITSKGEEILAQRVSLLHVLPFLPGEAQAQAAWLAIIHTVILGCWRDQLLARKQLST